MKLEREQLAEIIRHWPVLAGSALGVSLGLALFPLYVLPLLNLQFEHLLGWSRVDSASLLAAMSLGTLVGMPLAGWIVDRFGPRWPAALSTAILGALLVAAPLLPGSINAWRIGTFIFAVLGGPTGPVAYARAICDSFARARGLALGLTFGAIGVAGAIMPSVMIGLMGKLGAAQGLQMIGFVYLLLMAPLIALLLRTRAPRIAAMAASPHAVTPIARGQWVKLILGFMLLTAAAFGAGQSIAAMARDSHAGPPALMLAALSIAIAAARPLSGFMIDLASAQIVAFIVTSGTAIGLLLIAAVPMALPAGAVLIGLSLGAEVDILAFLVSRYVAPARESRVFSLIYFLVVGSNALAPLGFAQVRVHTGGYGPALVIAAVAVLVAGVLIGTLPRYARAIV